MVVFVLDGYRLPFHLIELRSVKYIHTHRTATNATWKEPMQLSFCVPGMPVTRLRAANDNEESVAHG